MKKLLLLLLFLPILLVSQNIPVIYAQGGVSWSEWKKDIADADLYQYAQYHVNASSTLVNQGSSSYESRNLNDDDPTTCWVEGESDYGIGEYFVISPEFINDAGAAGENWPVFDLPNIIYNGYQKSSYLWINNSRVKKFKIYHNNEPVCYLVLQDKMGAQYFDLTKETDISETREWWETDSTLKIKFEIIEIYKGNKWSDVAISQLSCLFQGDSAYAYYQRGQKNKGRKNYEDAIADFTRAIKIDPNYIFAYRFRGNAYNELGDYENAIADYTRVIRIDPNNSFAYKDRGISKENAGLPYCSDYKRACELSYKSNKCQRYNDKCK